jgi:toluene monooxygenase electron transfer component
MAKITISNAATEFDCADDDTLLRAALRAGLGMSYECNVGSCGNCRFELQEGSVVHERADAPGWNERDKQRNRFLGCQARPQGNCTIKVPLRADYKSRFLPVRTQGELIGIEDLTHDMREFRFRIAQPTGFLSGQYALVTAPGVVGARAYSMSNVAEDGAEWHFGIRRVAGGGATSFLFDALKVGQQVELDGPYGLAYLREDAPRDILCLGGGSGLSPMLSIVRAAAAHPNLQERKIHLVYGGRTAKDICGEPRLRDLPGFGARIFYHPVVSEPGTDPAEWKGLTGFVHDAAHGLFGEQLRDFEIYFAGPPAMADAIMKMAIGNKVPVAQLHFDKFY